MASQTSNGERMATKLKGLTKPNWELALKHKSDGLECRGGSIRTGASLTGSQTDNNCPTWSPEKPVKGDGKDKSKYPQSKALEIGGTGTAAEAIYQIGTTDKGAKGE